MPAKAFKFNCLPILCWLSSQWYEFWLLNWLFLTLDRGAWTIVKQPIPMQCGMCLLKTSVRLTAMGTGKGQWLLLSRDSGHNLRKK